MSNAIRFIVKRFAFKNSCILCLALIFDLNSWLCRKTSGSAGACRQGQQRRVDSFFEQLIQINDLVVKVSSREFGDLGCIPDEC